MKYLSGFFNSNTHLYVTGSHKNQLQIRCTERSPSLPALSLSLLFTPFPQQNTLSSTSKTHTPQQHLHSLTLPLIFYPLLPHLHCVRSLAHLELQKPIRRNPRLPTLNTTQVSHVAHLSHLQLVNPLRHCGSAKEKFVSPLLVRSYFSLFS